MATTSFPAIRQELLKKLYAGRYPITGTATDGTTSTLVDSSAALSGATADAFDHAWIKVVTTTDNLAPQGEVRQISEGGFTAASGTFTVSSNFTVAPASGDTYEIHYDYHPSELDAIQNEIARNLWVPALFPLSAHLMASDDNDMESSATTAWAEVGDGALSKGTSPLFGGTRVLTLTGVTALDYAIPSSNNFSCNPNLQYCTAVLCAVTDGDSARLQIIDVTNSNATIDQTAAVTLTDWQELYIQWKPPSGCRSMQPRFVSVGAGDVSNWDDYQTWVLGSYSYVTPSWISMKAQVIDVRGFPVGNTSVGGDSDYVALRERSVPLPWSFEQEDWAGTNEVRLNVATIGNIRPYIIARRPITAVSYDYGTAGVGAGALGSPVNTFPLTTQQADILVIGMYAQTCKRIAARYDGQRREYYQRESAVAERQYRAGVHQMGLGEPVVRQKSNRTAVTVN